MEVFIFYNFKKSLTERNIEKGGHHNFMIQSIILQKFIDERIYLINYHNTKDFIRHITYACKDVIQMSEEWNLIVSRFKIK